MIYVTGDTHGDIERFQDPRLKRLGKGDTLFVCGDFGFLWDDSKQERKAIKQLAKKKYNICFVDGTHENFDLLDHYEAVEWNGGLVRKIAGNVYHMMRGQIFNIDGVKIFTMGGGESPDMDIRLEKRNWSNRELPSREELLAGAQNIEAADCKVDLVITHEPPGRIKGFLKLSEARSARVTALNAYFDELNETCQYTKWFFGSLHVDKFVSSNQVAVYRQVLDALTGQPIRKQS